MRLGRRQALAASAWALAASAWSLAGCAAPPQGAVPAALAWQPLADGVHWLPGACGLATAANGARVGNAGLIVGPQGALMVETGVSARHGRALLGAVSALGGPPLRLAVVTHAHQEFLFGIAALRERGIPVGMSTAAARLMVARCDNCLKNLRALLGAAEMAGSAVLPPDRMLDGIDQLPGLGRDVRLLHLGHAATPGDLAVWDVASGTLFAGGLVDAQRIPDLQDGQLPAWRAALARLAALPGLARIVPGHGPVGGPSLIATQLAYFDALEARVAALFEAGTSLAEVSGQADLPAYSHWAGYDTLHRRNVALVYLRLEQAELLR